MLEALPKEVLALVLERAVTAGDIARAGMVSRALCWVLSDPVVWKQAALRQLTTLGMDARAPWVQDVLAERGPVWLRRASEPMDDPRHTGLAFRQGENNVFLLGEFVQGSFTGFGAMWKANKNVLLLGEWVKGRPHGRILQIEYPFGRRHAQECRAGRGHGACVMSYCVCRPDDDDRPNASPPECYPPIVNQHLELHGRASKHGEFGYVQRYELTYGTQTGPSFSLYCNGDVHQCVYDGKGDVVPASDRFMLSPRCPDPLFRSFQIEGVRWEHPLVQRDRAKGGGGYVASHPDPVAAPREYRVYYEYFKRGYMMIEQRDMDDFHVLYGALAQRLPPEVASADLADLIAATKRVRDPWPGRSDA